jgi:hypothetical protein
LIAKICAEPEAYLHRVVVLRGFFRGWQVTKCKFPERAAQRPLTRSDWLIQTDNSCAYVTGNMPQGLDPMNPASVGRLVEIKAEIMQTDDGKIYFVSQTGRVI